MKNKNKKEKNKSLMRLQREYLKKTLDKIDQMEELSHQLLSLNDEELIQKYVQQIDDIEREADADYKIACDIENVIKR
jgi:uncharacterized protein Yka (UPF0111/DUF47 family)